MFIIDNSGKRFDISKDAKFRFMQNVTVFDKDVKLRDAWNAYFSKYNHVTREYDFVKEKKYNHKPTDDELLFEMGQADLSYGDYVEVCKIKELTYDE